MQYAHYHAMYANIALKYMEIDVQLYFGIMYS